MHERRCVVSERESRRTRVLEKRGIHRPLTRLRAVIMVPTTQLIGVKSLAPALTRDNGSVTGGVTVL